MNVIEQRQYEMLVRVRTFGTTYGHLFPASSVAGETFAAVDAHQGARRARAGAPRSRCLGTCTAKRHGAPELLDRLQAIAQTARVLRQGDPGLVQQFEVPAPATDQTLLATGRKFARDAEAFSSQFVAHGMPGTFVADLNGLVNDFETALRDRGQGAKRAVRPARAPRQHWRPGSPPSAASTPSSPTICATMR
jgi:hypothetical protein